MLFVIHTPLLSFQSRACFIRGICFNRIGICIMHFSILCDIKYYICFLLHSSSCFLEYVPVENRIFENDYNRFVKAFK